MKVSRLITLLMMVAASTGCCTGCLGTGTPLQLLHRMGAKIEPLGGRPVRISLRGKRVSWLDLSAASALCTNHSNEYSELRELDLSRSTVSDDGLNSMVIDAGNWEALRVLDLRDTKVSESAIFRLQEALPQCKIIH